MTENQEFKEKNIGLLIAAGYSSRAKAFKMLLPYKDSTIIENSIKKMLLVCNRVFIIVGYLAEKLAYLEEKYKNVKLLYNENFDDGMYSSIKKGFTYLKNENFDRLIYCPGDYPSVSERIYEDLLKQKGDVIIPFHKTEKKKGHPIVIKSELIKSRKFYLFETLREFLNIENICYLQTNDDGILIDLDTIEDYQKLLELN